MKQRQNLELRFLNTPFDRQIRIENWSQHKLQSQSALILGIGGLGSVIMMSLLRLGIGKLRIIDNDVVQTHNLNRQLIYTKKDIGKEKVESALTNSELHNMGETKVQGFNGNALTNWKTVVAYAVQSDVLFNCIDYGDQFDLAVAALGLAVGIPVILGGTFATSMTIDYFSPTGRPCFLCSSDQNLSNKKLLQKLTPNKIKLYTDISFLKKNNNPISQSSIIVCTVCGQMMVSHYLNNLFLHQPSIPIVCTPTYPQPSPPSQHYKGNRMICYHNTFQMFTFQMQRQLKCHFCGDPNYKSKDPGDFTDSI